MNERKVNLWNVKDFIKTDDSKVRLQSLRIPRDLSLGGTKIKKKSHVPNLNIVRNKEKCRNFGLKEAKHRKRSQSNQGRQKNETRFVQTQGVFSEGIGTTSPYIKLSKKEQLVEKCKDEAVQIPISSKNVFTLANKASEEVVEDTIIEPYSSDVEDEEKCPFLPFNWSEKCLQEANDNYKIKIGSEENCLQKIHVSNNYLINADRFEKLYKNFREKLTMWKLPDALPVRKPGRKLFDCKLSDMPEGQIGKILMRKSGKTDIVIGNIKYQLEESDLECPLEWLVTIDHLKEMASVLGNLENRFHLTPDWESFL